MPADGRTAVGHHEERPSAVSAITIGNTGSTTTPEVAAPGDVDVRVHVDGDLATVVLDRPRRLNAQTPHTWSRLRAIGSGLPGSVRVVLVTARGRAFSAGLDRSLLGARLPGTATLSELAELDPAAGEAVIEGFQAAFGWLARTDLISIAAVQGHAVGAGFQLALACDLRVAATDAIFAMAEVPLGLVPDLGGTRRLVELVGYSRAMDICLTGRDVPAAEALAMGLVNRVVAAEDLGATALETAHTVLRAPREAVIEAKALLLAAGSRRQRDQEAAERAAAHRLLRGLSGLDPD